MRPLVSVSKTFQSEKEIWLGLLLPKIYSLQSEFASLTEKSSKSCKPLIRALQDGLKRRFAQMMKDPELAAAAILLPEFKTTWTDEKDVISAGKVPKTYILFHLCVHVLLCCYLCTVWTHV